MQRRSDPCSIVESSSWSQQRRNQQLRVDHLFGQRGKKEWIWASTIRKAQKPQNHHHHKHKRIKLVFMSLRWIPTQSAIEEPTKTLLLQFPRSGNDKSIVGKVKDRIFSRPKEAGETHLRGRELSAKTGNITSKIREICQNNLGVRLKQLE